MRKQPFTLLELIVVMTIMFLAVGMGVALFKGQSPARKLDSAALEWEEFCARVRYQALESGDEREIVFDPENRRFKMKEPARLFKMRLPEPPENASEEEEEERPRTPLEWKLPEDFELSSDYDPFNAETDEDGTLPMCKFFSDGSAAGQRRLVLKIGELQRTFEISALTGRMIEVREPEGSVIP